jgi:hypothetical protein
LFIFINGITQHTFTVNALNVHGKKKELNRYFIMEKTCGCLNPCGQNIKDQTLCFYRKQRLLLLNLNCVEFTEPNRKLTGLVYGRFIMKLQLGRVGVFCIMDVALWIIIFNQYNVSDEI